MVGELAQVGGLFFGGVLLAATCAMSKVEKPPAIAPNRTTAVETYCRDCDNSVESKNNIILGPPLSDEYSSLIKYFRSKGFRSGKTLWFMTVDFKPLLPQNADFSSERKLNSELIALGLIMVPGEAYGNLQPGS